MRKIEKEEERVAYDQPDKKVYHLCIVNLVIGYVTSCRIFLWPPYVIGADIIFLPCDFYLLSSFFFSRLISAVGDWMSTILLHMVWP